jgi:SAM-dependent methyltransferase
LNNYQILRSDYRTFHRDPLKSETLSQLHAPLIPILRHALALAPLPRAGVALDLACGSGLKAALLAEALGPGVHLVGVDIDPAVFRAVTTDRRQETGDRRQETGDRTEDEGLRTEDSAHPLTRSPARPLARPIPDPRPPILLVGDALALPLRDGCGDAAFCITALGLFADRRAALRELRRVLRPGALALLIVGTHAWAQVIPWPADLAACLTAAYAQALADGAAPIPAAPDLSSELADVLADAGFVAPLVRAFWLDHRPPTTDHRPPTTDHRPPTTDHRPPTTDLQWTTDHGPRTTDDPLDSELPLLPWPALRVLLARRLTRAELARCDALAAVPDVELCALALVALAHAP